MPLIFNKGKFLVNPHEIQTLPEGMKNSLDSNSINVISSWAETYLSQPHDLLGRDGPVCPFVKPAIDSGHFWVTVAEVKNLDEKKIHDLVIHYRDWFLKLEPTDGPDSILKTILILLPTVNGDKTHLIDKIQAKLKSHFVKRGLMLGQFYKSCEEPGLWNSSFFPLQSPIPLLAIREMVPSDFPFLKNDTKHLLYYLKKYGKDIPMGIKKKIIQSLNI
jgi:hypothetical protein